MKYFLGVDGGGTKTKFILTDYNLNIINSYTSKGCDFHHIGVNGVCNVFKTGLDNLLDDKLIKKQDIISATWGISCFGETPSIDSQIVAFLKELLPNTKQQFFNDVELGIAGSLALNNGIHIVSGTGAITIGKDSLGTIKRCSGWDEHFGDEGSSFWLGLNTLRIFTKEADGRLTKGALYSLIKDEFSLKEDFDLINYFYTNLNGHRDKIAKVQILLHKAAIKGDINAINLFDMAAYELFLSVDSLLKQLHFDREQKIFISYSGGTFKADNFILDPLTKYLSKYNVEIISPKFSPAKGAILLASKDFLKQEINKFFKNLGDKNNEQCNK
ncbi:MAG: N-acetylglucosamine kinase [Pleomorphochaeta sp.]